jgi:T5SS/PEP-CTERM-associated repeat protein
MRTHLLTTTAVLALLSASTVSTRAQTNWTGAISSDWFNPGNWTAGIPVLGGTNANINVTLPNATVVGAPGAVAQTLVVGQIGVGNLTIQNGGTLFTFTGGVVGQLGRGDVTVTGQGSQWTNVNGGIQVGSALPGSIGTLTVKDGGSVSDTPSGTPVGGLITVGGGGGFRGALIGNGLVTSTQTQINAGGFLVPGQGIVPGQGGTPDAMRFIGNLAFQSGAFYVVQVNPTTASTSNVLGTASLAGTVVANFAPGSFVSRSYTILTAVGGVTGTFDALRTLGLPTNFAAGLSYTGNTALLNIKAQLVPEGGIPGQPGQPGQPPIPGGQPIPGLPPLPEQQPAPPLPTFTVNQLNVGHAIDNFFDNGGALPPAFLSLFNLTGTNLTTALDQLSGEPATGAQKVAFQLTNQFLDLMLDPFVDGRCGIARTDQPPLGYPDECEPRGSALGFAPEREGMPPAIASAYASVLKEPRAPLAPVYEPRWTAWAGAYGGSNRTTGDLAIIGSHDLSANTVGGAAGLDYHLTPDTVLGFALGGGGTNWSLSQGLGGGRSDAFQAGLYGATRWGPAYLAADFAFTNHWMTTDRLAVFDHLSADFNAQSYGGRLEGGYRFGMLYGGITPYAAIQAQSFHTPGFTETDAIANGFGLAFGSRDATDTRSELGTRFDRVLAVYSNAVLALRGRIAWAHDWVSDATLMPVFQSLPGASFIVNGATLPKNSALTSAGAELRLANGVTLLAKFDGDFASHSSTYGGTGTFRYRW